MKLDIKQRFGIGIFILFIGFYFVHEYTFLAHKATSLAQVWNAFFDRSNELNAVLIIGIALILTTLAIEFSLPKYEKIEHFYAIQLANVALRWLAIFLFIKGLNSEKSLFFYDYWIYACVFFIGIGLVCIFRFKKKYEKEQIPVVDFICTVSSLEILFLVLYFDIAVSFYRYNPTQYPIIIGFGLLLLVVKLVGGVIKPISTDKTEAIGSDEDKQKETKDFRGDGSVCQKSEDEFDRYDFSARIAKTIADRKSSDGIVMGIYGAWGEGKSSVLGFIETELKNEENKAKNVVVVKFNPWRYNDENVLLGQFFEKLETALDTNPKTKNEEIAKLLKRYGKLVSINIPVIGNIGELLKNVGEVFGQDQDIEKLKQDINNALKKTNTKIVVFIDDIDRLEKDEVQSIFRLVKLTADFWNTTYLLAFDDEMVAASVGERFGAGNKEAGQSFIEKIIQVPINMPVMSSAQLKEFCFKRVDNAIGANNIQLTDDEKKRFEGTFTLHLLSKLGTPRLAIRYTNALLLSLPMLYGEVNMVDLMLIEAVRLLYPEHYRFVGTNQSYFTSYSGDKAESEVLPVKKKLKELSKNLTEQQKEDIKNLLCELFPSLNKIFTNSMSNDFTFPSYLNQTNLWLDKKRIGDSKYFSKYFRYGLIKSELSDVDFEAFLSEIPTMSDDEMAGKLKALISQISIAGVLYEFRSIRKSFDWSDSKKFARVLCTNPNLLLDVRSDGSYYNSYGIAGEAVTLIHSLIAHHYNRLEQFEFAKELMKVAKPFDFAYILCDQLGSDEPQHKIFEQEQCTELFMQLIEIAKAEAGDLPVFEKFPGDMNMYVLFVFWAKYDKKGLDEYIEPIFTKDPVKCIKLLFLFTPNISLNGGKPYKTDYDQKRFKYMISMIDKEMINAAIDKVYTKAELDKDEIFWIEDETSSSVPQHVQTEINVVRQFKRCYNQEKTGDKNSA